MVRPGPEELQSLADKPQHAEVAALSLLPLCLVGAVKEGVRHLAAKPSSSEKSKKLSTVHIGHQKLLGKACGNELRPCTQDVQGRSYLSEPNCLVHFKGLVLVAREPCLFRSGVT